MLTPPVIVSSGGHREFGTPGEYSVLDTPDGAEDSAWILLQRVPQDQVSVHSGTHLDFRVDDVAGAARQIEEIGGVLVKPAAFYPDADDPMLEWAILRDPFGNEFCIIRYPLIDTPI